MDQPGEPYLVGANPEWLFPSATGTLLDDRHVARAARRVFERAELPAFALYDLRHTYASLLLSANVPLLYVMSQQLGHAKATITLKYYARWIPSGNANHVDVLETGARRTAEATNRTPATTATYPSSSPAS